MEGTKYMEEPVEQPDSDAEEEIKEHKEGQFQLTFHLDKFAGALTDGGKVVVCDPGTAQALVKIVFDTELSEVGKVEVTAEGKTEDALTIHAAKGVVFVFVLPSMSASHCSQAIDTIYPSIAQKNCLIVGLHTVYKTAYATSDGHMAIDSEKPYPIKFTKTSHADPALEAFLASSKEQIEADTAFNRTSGMTAGLLMESEMNGKAAVSLKCIVGEHFITTESL